MHQYTFLPHTADIRMYVEASTTDELFVAALEGMNSILDPSPADRAHELHQTYPLKLTSLDTTTLLIDFLSDVLTADFEMKTIFNTLEIIRRTSNEIDCILYGYPVEHFAEDIKAVTYHEAEVIRNANGNFETVVIFDI